MKKIIGITICILLLICNVAYAENENIGIMKEQMDILNIGELQKIVDDTVRENDYISRFNVKDFLLGLITGESKFDLQEIGKGVGEIFFKELKYSLRILSKVLVITLISAILTNLQSTFENTSVSELANYISYILIAILVISSFNQIIEIARNAIDNMVGFMQAILPILLTLLTVASGVNTKIFFHPMILMSVNFIGILIKNIILPLVYFTFIVSIISNISKRIEFNKLSSLGRQVITVIISGSLTLFIGIITIYGLGSKIDGLTIRTAKFAVDKFVPIVGGFLSDAFDAVISCSAILKNGVGFIGLFILVVMCILPVIKILVLLFTYKVIGIVIQPICSENLVEFFNQVSKSLLLVLVSLIATATMFFITITIIVEAGNNLLMLR